MRKKTLSDLRPESLAGRRVLVRVDFNVPLDDGAVGDDTRIRRTLPTLRHLREQGARTILLSHLGRPKGEPDPALSLEPVAGRLSELLGVDVTFADRPAGESVREAAEALDEGGILLLENTRFHPGETANDGELAASWAALGDLYVGDAFGSAHRAHASTEGLPRAIRERGGDAVAGFLMERELRFLDEALEDPERPFVAVLGGAKITGKIDVVHALLPRVDRLLVGGAMANTFFLALGLEVGESLVEEDRVETAREAMEQGGGKLVLPVDCVVAEELSADAETRTVDRGDVGEGERIGDIGPRTREIFGGELATAGTVAWNGPMGVFELPPFAGGTLAVARSAADAADAGALVVVGGGDSAGAVEEAGVADRLTHVSTGGGASLELLAGKSLPGVEALSDANSEEES